MWVNVSINHMNKIGSHMNKFKSSKVGSKTNNNPYGVIAIRANWYLLLLKCLQGFVRVPPN